MATGNNGANLPNASQSTPGANVAQWLNQSPLGNTGEQEALNNAARVGPASSCSRTQSSVPPQSPGNPGLNQSGGSGLDAIAPPNFNNSGSSGGSYAGGAVVARAPEYGAVAQQRPCTPRPVNLNISGIIQVQGGNCQPPTATPCRAFISLQPNIASPASNFVPPVPGAAGGGVDFQELSRSTPPRSYVGDRANALDTSGNSGLMGMSAPPSLNSSGGSACGRGDVAPPGAAEPCVPCEDDFSEAIMSGDGAILAGSPRPLSVPPSPNRTLGEYMRDYNLPPVERVGLMGQTRDFSFASSYSSEASQRPANVTPEAWSPASVPGPGYTYTPPQPLRYTRREDIFRTPPRPQTLCGDNFNMSGASGGGGGLSGLSPVAMMSPGSSMGSPKPLCGDNLQDASFGSGLSGQSPPGLINDSPVSSCSRPVLGSRPATPAGPTPCSRPPIVPIPYNNPGTPIAATPCSRPATPCSPNFDVNALGNSPGLNNEAAPSFNDTIDSFLSNNPLNASGGSGLSQIMPPMFANSPVASPMASPMKSPIREQNIPYASTPGPVVPGSPALMPVQPLSPQRNMADYYQGLNLPPVERQGIFGEEAPAFDTSFSSAGNSSLNRALPLYSPTSVPSPFRNLTPTRPDGTPVERQGIFGEAAPAFDSSASSGGNSTLNRALPMYSPTSVPSPFRNMTPTRPEDIFRTPPRPDVVLGENMNFSGASNGSGLDGVQQPNMNETVFSSIRAPSLNDSNASALNDPMFPTFYSSFSSEGSAPHPMNSTSLSQNARNSQAQQSPNMMQFSPAQPSPNMVQFSPAQSSPNMAHLSPPRAVRPPATPMSELSRAAAIAFGTPPRDFYPSPLLGIRPLAPLPGGIAPSPLVSARTPVPSAIPAHVRPAATPGTPGSHASDVSALDAMVRDARDYYLNMSQSPTIGGAEDLSLVRPGPRPDETPDSSYDWSGFFN